MKIILISTVAMLALPSAIAEVIPFTDAPLSAVRDQPSGNAVSAASAAAPLATEPGQDAISPSESGDGRAEARRRPLNVDNGWRWTFDGQRPSIEYRLSESGVMRFRGARGGAGVVFMWNY